MKQLLQASHLCYIIKILDRINNIECTEAYRRPGKYARFLEDTDEIYLPFARAVDAELAKRMQRGTDRVREELAVLAMKPPVGKPRKNTL